MRPSRELLLPRFYHLPPTLGRLTYYERRSGESLLSTARRFGVSLLALYRANPNRAEGKPLLIPALFFPPPGEPDLVAVNLAERMVYIYDDKGQPTAAYPIAIGRIGWETPTGDFIIVRKAKNPTWFPPSWAKLEHPVPPGPGNPLGDRWMGLSVPGYGLHATNAPASIGRAASHGCMRMYPEHARALYPQVHPRTKVRIIYETLLLGYSPEHRAVFLSIYPDIYRKGTNDPARVKTLLFLAGLSEIVEEEQIRLLVKTRNGVPFPLLGSDLRLQVNGAEMSLPVNPTPRGDDYLIPAESLAEILGAGLSLGPDKGWYVLRRGKNWFAFSPGKSEAAANFRPVSLSVQPRKIGTGAFFSHAGGKMKAEVTSSFINHTSSFSLFVPLKPACDALGVSVRFDPGTRTLYLTDPAAFLRPPTLSSFRHFVSQWPVVRN